MELKIVISTLLPNAQFMLENKELKREIERLNFVCDGLQIELDYETNKIDETKIYNTLESVMNAILCSKRTKKI